MTALPDPRGHQTIAGTPLDAGWRAAGEAIQQQVLPRGRVVVSCSAPLGGGGLGRHLSEIVDALGRAQQPCVCMCGSTRESASSRARAPRHALGLPYLARVLPALHAPTSPGVRMRAVMEEFDAYVAQNLPAAEHLIAFNSQALTQFRAARRAGYESVSLVSANSHLRRVARQHAIARAQYPLEGSWATRLVKRNLDEYAEADRIYVASRYTRESFLEEGVPDELLAYFPLMPDPRYRPQLAPAQELTDHFEIVYVGSLAVHKGVPLLIDAVRRLRHADLRLRLVGGWGTPGMRRFVQQACAQDSRITASFGDPLVHLRRASLCVHPAYEDGFGYAPAEALASGVPVIVSEDTGMKDLIDEGRDGLVLATGDLDSLTQAIDAAYRGEILGLPGSRTGARTEHE
jgi:glycosyltransferase involved in cell wall biosynthesis